MAQVDVYKRLVLHLGGPTRAAKCLRVKQGTASGWINGSHGMSPAVALLAESITNGLFKAAELNSKIAQLQELTALRGSAA